MKFTLTISFVFLFSKLVISQQYSGKYLATSFEFNKEKSIELETIHSLILNPDLSFIYKKESELSDCKYTYIGKWNNSKDKLTLDFFEDESQEFSIMEISNKHQIFLKNNELIFHSQLTTENFGPLDLQYKKGKKKIKDAPCPKF